MAVCCNENFVSLEQIFQLQDIRHLLVSLVQFPLDVSAEGLRIIGYR